VRRCELGGHRFFWQAATNRILIPYDPWAENEKHGWNQTPHIRKQFSSKKRNLQPLVMIGFCTHNTGCLACRGLPRQLPLVTPIDTRTAVAIPEVRVPERKMEQDRRQAVLCLITASVSTSRSSLSFNSIAMRFCTRPARSTVGHNVFATSRPIFKDRSLSCLPRRPSRVGSRITEKLTLAFAELRGNCPFYFRDSSY
jgi:hypothetical protein